MGALPILVIHLVLSERDARLKPNLRKGERPSVQRCRGLRWLLWTHLEQSKEQPAYSLPQGLARLGYNTCSMVGAITQKENKHFMSCWLTDMLFLQLQRRSSNFSLGWARLRLFHFSSENISATLFQHQRVNAQRGKLKIDKEKDLWATPRNRLRGESRKMLS